MPRRRRRTTGRRLQRLFYCCSQRLPMGREGPILAVSLKAWRDVRGNGAKSGGQPVTAHKTQSLLNEHTNPGGPKYIRPSIGEPATADGTGFRGAGRPGGRMRPVLATGRGLWAHIPPRLRGGPPRGGEADLAGSRIDGRQGDGADGGGWGGHGAATGRLGCGHDSGGWERGSIGAQRVWGDDERAPITTEMHSKWRGNWPLALTAARLPARV